MQLDGGMNNLQIFSSYYENSIRETYKKQVSALAPVACPRGPVTRLANQPGAGPLQHHRLPLDGRRGRPADQRGLLARLPQDIARHHPPAERRLGRHDPRAGSVPQHPSAAWRLSHRPRLAATSGAGQDRQADGAARLLGRPPDRAPELLVPARRSVPGGLSQPSG